MSDWQIVLPGNVVKDLYDDYSIIVKTPLEFGLATEQPIEQDMAIGDGVQHIRSIVGPRTIQLVCSWKWMATPYALHSARKKIASAINRDALNGAVFMLRFTGAASGSSIEIPVRYMSGLGGNDIRGANEDFTLNLRAADPFWRASAATNVNLAGNGTLTGASYLAQSSSGIWSALAASGRPAAAPSAFLTDGSGNLWAAAGSKVYKYAAGAWSSWTVAGGGAAVYALARDAVGNIYVGGDFNSINGVSSNSVAKWDGSVWAALASGFSGKIVHALVVDQSGSLWAGGNMTVPLASWDGSAWTNSSFTFKTGSVIYALAVGLSGELYLGGDLGYTAPSGGTWATAPSGDPIYPYALSTLSFTGAGAGLTQDGTVANYTNGEYLDHYGRLFWDIYSDIGRASSSPIVTATVVNGVLVSMQFTSGVLVFIQDPTGKIIDFSTTRGLSNVGRLAAGVMSYLNGGLDGIVRSLAVASNGNVYAGGDFTGKIAVWNGSAWSTVGAGVNNTVEEVALDSSDIPYVVGSFTNTGHAYFAKYSSGAWISGGIAPQATGTAVNINGSTITIGYNTATPPPSSSSPGDTTIVNPGDRNSYPVITITRAGGTTATLRYLINTFTGDQLLSSYALQDGETLTITCTPGGRKIVSSVNGAVMAALLTGSKLSTWCVSPGSHAYTLLVETTGGPTITAILTYTPSYSSLDGVAA